MDRESTEKQTEKGKKLSSEINKISVLDSWCQPKRKCAINSIDLQIYPQQYLMPVTGIFCVKC